MKQSTAVSATSLPSQFDSEVSSIFTGSDARQGHFSCEMCGQVSCAWSLAAIQVMRKTWCSPYQGDPRAVDPLFLLIETLVWGLIARYLWKLAEFRGFPGGTLVKNPPAKAGDARDEGLIPGFWRFPRGGHGNPLWYSCLEDPIDRRTCRATVHGVAKMLTTHTRTHEEEFPTSSSVYRYIIKPQKLLTRLEYIQRCKHNFSLYSCPHFYQRYTGNPLAFQWLGLSAFTAGAPGSIPGWGTKISQATHIHTNKQDPQTHTQSK